MVWSGHSLLTWYSTNSTVSIYLILTSRQLLVFPTFFIVSSLKVFFSKAFLGLFFPFVSLERETFDLEKYGGKNKTNHNVRYTQRDHGRDTE
jgi:cytochrome c biogenesis factor